MTLSMFAGVAAVVLVQPPTEAPKPAAAGNPPLPMKRVIEAKLESLAAAKPETLDEQIQRAVVSHPDLRVARAQVELAQAKLMQEHLRVTQRITAARAARAAAAVTRDNAKVLLDLSERVARPREILLEGEEKVNLAQERLAAAEAELEAAVGGPPRDSDNQPIPPGGPPKLQPGPPMAAPLTTLRAETVTVYKPLATPVTLATPVAPPTGFPADFARMLDARITPQVKKGNPHQLLAELLGKAAAAVGRPAPVVRLDMLLDETVRSDVRTLTLQGEADTLGAWLQQFDDELNSVDPAHSDMVGPRFYLLVRDYGLIVARSGQAPSGAASVADFWRRARVEKAAEAKPAPAKGP